MKSRFSIEIKDERVFTSRSEAGTKIVAGHGWKFEIWWKTELTMIASGYAPTKQMARTVAKKARAIYDVEYARSCGVKPAKKRPKSLRRI